MLSKIEALKKMEDTMPYHLVFLTADREKWKLKQKLTAQRNALPKESQEYIRLDSRISGIEAGGKIIISAQSLLAKYRGIHAKREKEMIQKPARHKTNRTLNLRFLPSKQIRKIHTSLILELNRIPVLY